MPHASLDWNGRQVGGSLGTALLNTIAATATATYIASHGARFAPEGLVHGFSVAFAVGAGLLALAAVVSGVLVTIRASELSPEPVPSASPPVDQSQAR